MFVHILCNQTVFRINSKKNTPINEIVGENCHTKIVIDTIIDNTLTTNLLLSFG